MQNYTEIQSSTTLSDSLSQILNNDKTALSLSSGTSFPTVNLQQGMPCFRTDEQKLYILTVVSPATWKMVIDLSAAAGKVANADLLDGIDSTGFALSGHNHDTVYAAIGHNHNAAYLGLTAKAADADKLDGYDSTAFVRSVNGTAPDVNGNAAVSIDLSSRVAKSGDTMTGTLTVPRLQIASTANYLDMVDQDWGTRSMHHNQGLMGFLKSDGNWDMYMNNGGSMWTANYGWLHDYFFSGVGNCGDGWSNCGGTTGNCITNALGSTALSQTVSNCGTASQSRLAIRDDGATISLVRQYAYFNCNCNCNCATDCNCGFCFPAGTQVDLADGSKAPIEEIGIGDRLSSGTGGVAVVVALHRVKLGSRKAYRVNGSVVTTGDHLFKTPEGWASLEPDLYATLRFNKPASVVSKEGWVMVNASAIRPEEVTQLTVGSVVRTSAGLAVVNSIEELDLPAPTQLYSFVTKQAKTFIADGYVVDGAPQEAYEC